MKELVNLLYWYLWHVVFRRPEPFTATMRRSYHDRPLLWVLIMGGAGLLLGHLFW